MNGVRESEIVVYVMLALWVSASVQCGEISPLSSATWAQKPGPQRWPSRAVRDHPEDGMHKTANSRTILGAPASQESWTGSSQLMRNK